MKRRDNIDACIVTIHKAAAKTNMEKHMSAIHKMEKQYQCKECNFKTAYKKCLKDHVSAIHEKIRPYECSY